jgi:hypothetical protein
MTTRIGKYKIIESDSALKIKYIYSISDFFGSLIYFMGMFIGMFLIYVFIYNAQGDKKLTASAFIVLLVGFFFTFWFGRIFYILLVTLRQNCLEIHKASREILIFDYKKIDRINYSNLASIYCEIKETYKPKSKHGLLMFQTTNRERIEGFIIRSSIPIDLGKKVDKEIYTVAKQLKDKIFDYILT